ncbi:MAG: hypothetical protein WC955_04955 [Elusimicrobiota bacterium]
MNLFFAGRKVLFTIFCLVVSAVILYAIPMQLNFQGRLTDNAGMPYNGTENIIFTLFDSEAAGNSLWMETHNNVVITNGIFNIVLGSYTAFTDTVFNADDVWLEIQPGTDVLAPRQKFVSVPYTFTAANAAKLNGMTYDMFLSTGGGIVEGDVIITGTATIRGSLAIGGDAADTRLRVDGEVKSVVNSVEFYMIPKGGIIMWSGAEADIPAGWALCDGTNGTPDLRNRFVIGAGDTYAFGDLGGETTHYHTVDIATTASTTAGAHTHSIDVPITTSSSDSHSHTANTFWFSRDIAFSSSGGGAGSWYINITNASSGGDRLDPVSWGGATSSDAHTHTTNPAAFNTVSGGDHTHTVDPASSDSSTTTTIPPYFSLCFIMKL